MLILISAICRIFVISTITFAAFLQSSCPEKTVAPADNSNTKPDAPTIAANIAEKKPASGMKLFVPSYFNDGDYTADGNGKWNKLIKSLQAGDVMIVNPQDGPTSTATEGFTNAIKDARDKGIVVLGYVHTLDKDKKPQKWDSALIKKDIDRWREVYKIKDIFFDEFSIKPDTLEDTLKFYKDICSYVHKNKGQTTLNPGAVIDERFAAFTEWIVVFESPYDDPEHPKESYKNMDMAHWDWSSKPIYHNKIVHLILGAKKEFMLPIVKKALDANAAYVYVTNYNVGEGEWDRVAAYWDEEIAAVRK